jgi:hypothetical protein
VPVTPSGFEEQLWSRLVYEVLVAVEEAVVAVPVAVAVAVAVADANEALSCATLRSASFAWLALTPVPAARPMTAADSSAMMAHRTNSNTGQPQRVPFFFPPPRDGTAPAATGLV